ncbi:hypothetical protein BN1708_004527, partial [Verticillium longisporum]
ARLFHDFSDTRNSSNCVFAFDSVTKLHTYQQPTEAPLEACLQRATIASSNESRSPPSHSRYINTIYDTQLP